MCPSGETTGDRARTNKAEVRRLAEGAPPCDLTIEQFEAMELERVRFSMYTAVVCEAIPKRLGRDAARGALAVDKRIARSVENLYRSIWVSMDPDTAPEVINRDMRTDRAALAAQAGSGARAAGASVQWASWLRNRHEQLAEIAVMAAVIAAGSSRWRWGARRLRMLDLERENVERIMAEVGSRLARLRETG